MKSIVNVFVCITISAITFGCTYVSSRGEYTVGSGTFVHKESSSLVIKVIGDSKNTEISHFFVKRDEEERYTSEYSPNPSESLIDKTFRENMTSTVLPWKMEVTLEADEAVYIQVKPIDFNDEVTVEIWKDGLLQKEYVISNNILPFWTSYRL
jgi:hypothetical protein